MMPTDAERFKFWADRECIDWPGELTAQAYRAWCDLLGTLRTLARLRSSKRTTLTTG